MTNMIHKVFLLDNFIYSFKKRSILLLIFDDLFYNKVFFIIKINLNFFFFGTTTAVGQGLPVPTSEVSLAFSDLLLP